MRKLMEDRKRGAILHCMLSWLTARYGLLPMLVLVKELTVSAAMPKSHSLTSPDVLIRMLDGFTSVAVEEKEEEEEEEEEEEGEEGEEEEEAEASDTARWVPIPRCRTLRLAFRKYRPFTVCREQ